LQANASADSIGADGYVAPVIEDPRDWGDLPTIYVSSDSEGSTEPEDCEGTEGTTEPEDSETGERDSEGTEDVDNPATLSEIAEEAKNHNDTCHSLSSCKDDGTCNCHQVPVDYKRPMFIFSGGRFSRCPSSTTTEAPSDSTVLESVQSDCTAVESEILDTLDENDENVTSSEY